MADIIYAVFFSEAYVRRSIGSLLLLFSLCTLAGRSFPQTPGMPMPGPPTKSENEPSIPPDMQKDMEKKANLRRQTDLKRDTEKLLKLSTELKEYVDKTNESVMSLDVIKKADEIEKLAHSVKVKMRGDL
jgi:hypothetical protein